MKKMLCYLLVVFAIVFSQETLAIKFFTTVPPASQAPNPFLGEPFDYTALIHNHTTKRVEFQISDRNAIPYGPLYIEPADTYEIRFLGSIEIRIVIIDPTPPPNTGIHFCTTGRFHANAEFDLVENDGGCPLVRIY